MSEKQGSVWPGDRKCEGILRNKAENVVGARWRAGVRSFDWNLLMMGTIGAIAMKVLIGGCESLFTNSVLCSQPNNGILNKNIMNTIFGIPDIYRIYLKVQYPVFSICQKNTLRLATNHS